MKQYENDNNVIKIEKNWICYYDEILKISNISRIWIFMFQNQERKSYEEKKRVYENDKKSYEANETRKKNEQTRNYSFIAIGIILISFFVISKATFLGILILIAGGICGYMAYRTSQRKVEYYLSPPQEGSFPEKYGLGIQMSSSYTAVFSAIGNEGLQSLRDIQRRINEADTHQGVTVFNMNNVSFEGDKKIINEGILSVGDNNNNIINNKT
jgi:hypothetical protein